MTFNIELLIKMEYITIPILIIMIGKDQNLPGGYINYKLQVEEYYKKTLRNVVKKRYWLIKWLTEYHSYSQTTFRVILFILYGILMFPIMFSMNRDLSLVGTR